MELSKVFEQATELLDSENAARDQALTLCRECIRHSANSIRAVHRGEREESTRLRGLASERMSRAQGMLSPYPRIYNAGFLQDAEKEFAEAAATFSITGKKPIPSPDELGVGIAPYLNGLGEAAGELRRFVLDLIRTNRLDVAEDLLKVMDDIYFLLASIDYPSALTGGLRRTNDMVRGVLERTRGDLTNAIRRNSLEETIRGLERRLSGEGG
jgi:translin